MFSGIVRRIDDLGRIVIPKEMRKILGITNGDMIEIKVVDNDILISKYYPLSTKEEYLNKILNSLMKITKFDAIVTDDKKVILTSSPNYKNLLGKNLSADFLNFLNINKIVFEEKIVKLSIVDGDYNIVSYVVSPILLDNNVIGLFIILSKDLNVSNYEKNIALICSNLISNLD